MRLSGLSGTPSLLSSSAPTLCSFWSGTPALDFFWHRTQPTRTTSGLSRSGPTNPDPVRGSTTGALPVAAGSCGGTPRLLLFGDTAPAGGICRRGRVSVMQVPRALPHGTRDISVDEIRAELQQRANIILGSSSASRQGILREMGLEFTVMKPGIDELAIRRPTAEELVEALSRAKAEALIPKLREQQAAGEQEGTRTTLLITADQVVVHEGHILEKPESPEEARQFMGGYSRSPAGTVGAVLVTNVGTGFQTLAVDSTLTFFREIPDSVIDSLIAEGVVFNCAGGLMVEHPLVAPFVARMEGASDSVMGLPKDITWQLLHQAMCSSP